MKRRLAAAFAVLLAGIALTQGVSPSGADFVATKSNPINTFATAADFNTVSVSIADPGSPLRGAVALSATAASDRGIASVTFQSSPAGAGTWTNACVSSTAPYTCTFTTSSVSDGLKDIRAVALDTAGYSRSSLVASRRIDNTVPTVSMTNPGTPLRGTISLGVTASDGGSGLASIALQRKTSAGSTWIDVCTVASSPASCSLDTTTLADGLWDFQAVATDAAGNASTNGVTSKRVDNTAPTVTVTDAGPMRGTVTLASTNADAGSGVATVAYEYRTSPAGTWTAACTGATTPFSCSFNTVGKTDGLYDLRAIATDAAGNATTSAVVSSVRIDNTAPATTTMNDPGTPLSGTVAFVGSATDAGSGIATLRFQYAPAGTSTWTDACVDNTAPYTGCNWDSSTIADAVYDMRALSTDAAGNTLASATRANRRVDNFAPTASLTDPGSPLRATVNLAATATDGGGVASVLFERKPAAGSTWTTICTDNLTPFTCAWNTTALADGSYDLRATATDNAGRTATSTVTARVVDNTAPAASAVTSTSGGSATNLSTGDTFVLTYSENVAAATLLSGWNGTSRAVNFSFTSSGQITTAVVTDASSGTTVSVGTLSIADKLTAGAGATFAGTMVLSGNTLTLTLGAGGGSLKSGSNPMTLNWTVSTAVTDIAGNASTGNAVSGSGNL